MDNICCKKEINVESEQLILLFLSWSSFSSSFYLYTLYALPEDDFFSLLLLLILFFYFIVYREVEAIAGSESQLPCELSAWNSDKIALILWYRGNASIPIYTVDARNSSSLTDSMHIPALIYRNKAFMEIKQNSINLRIKKITINDAGEYRCRIDYLNSPTEDYLVNLTVIGEYF